MEHLGMKKLLKHVQIRRIIYKKRQTNIEITGIKHVLHFQRLINVARCIGIAWYSIVYVPINIYINVLINSIKVSILADCSRYINQQTNGF